MNGLLSWEGGTLWHARHDRSRSTGSLRSRTDPSALRALGGLQAFLLVAFFISLLWLHVCTKLGRTYSLKYQGYICVHTNFWIHLQSTLAVMFNSSPWKWWMRMLQNVSRDLLTKYPVSMANILLNFIDWTPTSSKARSSLQALCLADFRSNSPNPLPWLGDSRGAAVAS